MPLRIASYIALLYELLFSTSSKEFSHGLPPVLPIVLYNGKDPWTAERSLEKCIRLKKGAKLKEYQLHSKYFLIDIMQLTSTQMPEPPNLVSTIFDMEVASHLNQHGAIADSIKRLFVLTRNRSARVALREAFTIFCEGVLFHRGSLADNQQLRNLTEVHKMYSTIEESYVERLKEDLSRGIKKERLETALEWLHDLGASEDKWSPRLEKMSPDQLRQFTRRIARASSEQELED